MEINLSILIPTHNRPELFTKCINSVISQLDTIKTQYDIEILVNNDSNDITEIFDHRIDVKYFYKNTVIDGIPPHEYLYSLATKKWIYILEDDDTLFKTFFKSISNIDPDQADIILGTYIPDNDIKLYFKYFKEWFSGSHKILNLNLFRYQFGQILFKNNIISTLFDNVQIHKFSDCIPLIQFMNLNNRFYCTKDIFFVQNLDHKNKTNISFKYNTLFDYKNTIIDHFSNINIEMEKI